jgi:hypothetical protein
VLLFELCRRGRDTPCPAMHERNALSRLPPVELVVGVVDLFVLVVLVGLLALVGVADDAAVGEDE